MTTQYTATGLTKKQVDQSVAVLQTLLADEAILYQKLRREHWNVVGISFLDLHALFETQYREVEEIIDEVAERIVAFDQAAIGTFAAFLDRTRLSEAPEARARDAKAVPKTLVLLLADHEAIIRSLRTDIDDCTEKHHDLGTADHLTEILRKHEKMAWMLRALSQA